MRVKGFSILIIAFIFVFVISLNFVNSAEISTKKVNVYYFYGIGCSHCANVADSGILEKISGLENVSLVKYEIYYDQLGRQKFIEFSSLVGLDQYSRAIPLAIIECDGNYSYLLGDKPIIEKLEEKVIFCENTSSSGNVSPGIPNLDEITLGSIIIAAFIDSINPCAFGVLIFLMISLLKIGSAKRALRAGLIYTFVVFVVYFLSGFGIFKVIQAFSSITHFIYLFAGILVLFLGLWQFKDVLFPKFGPSLAISPKVKPLIERIISTGTIPAMILLGIVVSLFELPCTGGIYIAILTMMSIHKTFAIGYLLLYNLIFVLPLIILTLIIYKGINPETLQRWTSKERNWMKIASGLVLIALGAYILLF